MKRLYYILVALVLALSCLSCRKEDSLNTIVDGEWYGTLSFNSNIVAQVYLDFSKGDFTIYQVSGEQTRYYKYSGTYTVTDNIFSGRYSDGNPLGSDYKVLVDSQSLTLIALNGSEEEMIYMKAEIPQEVKDSAVLPVKK